MSNASAAPDVKDSPGYAYDDAELNPSHAYLLPIVESVLTGLKPAAGVVPRLFDLGCGNGSVSSRLQRLGFDVTGVDPSPVGIELAHRNYPQLKLHEGSAYDDLPARYGKFSVVVSLEVVEHVYAPKKFAACVLNLLEPGGTAIISTPYHGYFKNVVLALSGKMDDHYTALWDHGHIKFWSIRTLEMLLRNAGFVHVEFRRVGRFPAVAKSMVAIARRQ